MAQNLLIVVSVVVAIIMGLVLLAKCLSKKTTVEPKKTEFSERRFDDGLWYGIGHVPGRVLTDLEWEKVAMGQYPQDVSPAGIYDVPLGRRLAGSQFTNFAQM